MGALGESVIKRDRVGRLPVLWHGLVMARALLSCPPRMRMVTPVLQFLAAVTAHHSHSPQPTRAAVSTTDLCMAKPDNQLNSSLVLVFVQHHGRGHRDGSI